MAVNIRRPARARMWKHIAIAIASVSTVTLGTFTVISFLPKGNDAFSVRISDPSSDSHFHMSLRPSEKERSYDYLRAASLDYMELVDAISVEEYIASVASTEEGLSAENYFNVTDAEGKVLKSYALVYTVYLVNDSASEDQIVRYAVDIDGYKSPDNTSYLPFDYFRVLCQTQLYGSTEIKNTYYGENHTRYSYLYNEHGDKREAISTVRREMDEEGNPILVSKFKSEGNDGYCIPFEAYDEDLNAHIVNNQQFTIPAGGMMRFTFAAYYEGSDPDAQGQVPENSYLLLSLHFGV